MISLPINVVGQNRNRFGGQETVIPTISNILRHQIWVRYGVYNDHGVCFKPKALSMGNNDMLNK